MCVNTFTANCLNEPTTRGDQCDRSGEKQRKACKKKASDDHDLPVPTHWAIIKSMLRCQCDYHNSKWLAH